VIDQGLPSANVTALAAGNAISTSVLTTAWFAYRAEAALMKKLILAVIISILNSALLFAERHSHPRDQQQPIPPSSRSKNGNYHPHRQRDARVFVRQIFANTPGERGRKLHFCSSKSCDLSDFAHLDGPTRIPQSSSSASAPKKSNNHSSNSYRSGLLQDGERG